jgi:hypothetical protein
MVPLFVATWKPRNPRRHAPSVSEHTLSSPTWAASAPTSRAKSVDVASGQAMSPEDSPPCAVPHGHAMSAAVR